MKKITRRGIMAAGAGAVAAQAVPAKAATGDPLILGQENRARNDTVLRASHRNTSGQLLRVYHHGDGAAVVASNDWAYGVSDSAGLSAFAKGGTAVLASTETGFALRTEGRVHFRTSGLATIPAGQERLTVDEPAVSFDELNTEGPGRVVATLQADLGDVFLKAAVPHPDRGSFTLVLSGPAPKDANVAWFVMNG